MEEILTVSHLTTRFQLGKKSYPVVSDLSFSLKKGKTLALVGESGSGKSMTALSLLRILPTPPALPPEGEVLYQGKNLLTLSERELRKIRGSKISMIFQDPMSCLNPVYSVGEQLLEVLFAHTDLDEEAALKKAKEALDEVGIPEVDRVFESYPHQLSGGMKQRVMIASCLLNEPDILIADEPTTALDVTIQKQILDLMQELQQKCGMAILLITHDMGVVKNYADDVVVLYGGKEMQSGPVDVVFETLSHPYTEALFACLPQSRKPKERLAVIPGAVPHLKEMPDGCRFHPRCSHTMEKCKAGDVDLISLPSNQRTRCWLYEEE